MENFANSWRKSALKLLMGQILFKGMEDPIVGNYIKCEMEGECLCA